ncbi:hypothetical protein A0H81_08991 [Grifola frondosa]|uniref:Uncharacterized protein n=1 Tax=Grifola frondosa TaxID=5627 RepID=A0A1C7M3Y5_GRIFR|nr:hypothetical protein A0H81_08991 [Grifola frondosa]
MAQAAQEPHRTKAANWPSARLGSKANWRKDHSKPRRTKPDGAVATLEGAQGFLLGDPVILAPKRCRKSIT